MTVTNGTSVNILHNLYIIIYAVLLTCLLLLDLIYCVTLFVFCVFTVV